MANKKSIFEEGSTGAQKVAAFLSKAQVFYVGTVDGDQPRVRAFSWFDYQKKEDRVVFSTGNFKDAYKQMLASPKVEVFAQIGMYFMRYDGIAKPLDDEKLKAQVKHASPGITKIYEENGWEIAPFCLENGHVEVRYSLDPVEEFDV